MSNQNGFHRVVITGMGLVTPLGHNVEDSWAGIIAGKSGLGSYTQFEQGDHVSGGVCEVKDFDPSKYIGKRDARRRDRYQQFATVAANEAMAHSGLKITDDNRENIGIYMGTGVGGIQTLVEQDRININKGLRRISPFAVTMIMPNGAAGMIAIDHGIQGPTPTVATACASGNDAIGTAFRAIRYGEVVAALTGGSECPMTSTTIGGFERAGATSTKSTETPQPFDKNRDGLIPGEGAGMLVVESLSHALARGANILGEIVGYGQTTDAHHITAPAEGGRGAARAITRALHEANLPVTAVNYVSAHGTATPLNDRSETEAIKAALGEHAYNIGVSSTKSMTGHIMGATGAIESVFCMLAIRDQLMPPTINYQTPDPECDLDYIPNAPRSAEVNVALNNAFGFGGHNSVLAFKKYVD